MVAWSNNVKRYKDTTSRAERRYTTINQWLLTSKDCFSAVSVKRPLPSRRTGSYLVSRSLKRLDLFALAANQLWAVNRMMDCSDPEDISFSHINVKLFPANSVNKHRSLMLRVCVSVSTPLQSTGKFLAVALSGICVLHVRFSHSGFIHFDSHWYRHNKAPLQPVIRTLTCIPTASARTRLY